MKGALHLVGLRDGAGVVYLWVQQRMQVGDVCPEKNAQPAV